MFFRACACVSRFGGSGTAWCVESECEGVRALTPVASVRPVRGAGQGEVSVGDACVADSDNLAEQCVNGLVCTAGFCACVDGSTYDPDSDECVVDTPSPPPPAGFEGGCASSDDCAGDLVCTAGSPVIDCSGAPGVDGADCPTGCIYAAAVSAACEGTADDGATDCSTLAADTACTDVAGCTLSALQEASCGDDVAAGADSGGVETMADTDNCNLTPSGDFGVTPGQCAAVDPAVATCAYVSGTYSVSAPMDFFYGESCTLITPPTAEQCVTGAFALIQEEAEEAEPPPPPTAAPAADSSAAPRVVGMALLAAAAMASVFA